MPNPHKLTLVLAVAFSATGCIVVGDGNGNHPLPPSDVAVPLGVQQMLGYHVAANSAAALPAGGIGFIVTANGGGGYRLTWTDTNGSTATFAGTITTDTSFDPAKLSGYSGAEDLTPSPDYTSIAFSSTPGTAVDGVDLVSFSDPIYVDATVDSVHTGFGIYFTGAYSGQLLNSDYDPVAFTSP